MAESSSTWRSGASAPAPSSSTGGSSWGRGGSTTITPAAPSSSKRGGGSSRTKSSKSNANASKASNSTAGSSAAVQKPATTSAATKFLPTQYLPYNTLQNLNDYYRGIIESGLVKKAWLDNPKNPISNYVLHRTGTLPVYQVEEGQVEGRRDTNFRCIIVLDPEYEWAVYADAKTKKDAERTAALHAVYFLQDKGDILSKTPTASIPAPLVPQPGQVSKLSDGSDLTVNRAREFIDFYCKRFNLGKPDVRVTSGGKSQKGKRGAKSASSSSAPFTASMLVAGNELGVAQGKNKKQATANCFLDTVVYIESTDPDLWRAFNAVHKPGMPINKAPHVEFHMSDELDEEVRSIYDNVRQSKLFAKRPRTAGAATAGEAPSTAADEEDAQTKKREQRRQRARRFNSQFGATEEFLDKKSRQLEINLANYYSDDRMTSMRNQRLSLPVSQKQSDVLVKVELNQVTICMAATGSGKTTQIPQILFDDYILQGKGAKCNVICTQPRRIAAISVAERVAKERGEKLGQTVGYQVRFEAKPPEPNGSITFCTTGVFLRRLQSALGDADSSSTFLDSITHVVIDEVHERDVETDLLLVVIKRLLAERRRLGKKEIKVILMSATIDPALFQSYFADQQGRPAPVVEIPGRSYPVEKHYLEETVRNLEALRLTPQMGGWVWGEKNVRDYLDREIYQRGGSTSKGGRYGGGGSSSPYGNNPSANDGQLVDPMADQVDDLEIPYPLVALIIAYVLSISDDGHVLVFLPGWDEIKAVNQLLADTGYHPLLRTDFNDRDQYEIHVLHSSVPVQDQQAVFEPVRHQGIRRIILATNIAETSITIPDVVYVVDTGRVKEKRFDPERHLSSLVSAWVGTSNLNQRAGRAGRHRAGEYFGVLSKARYDRLRVNQTVEMKRTDLSNVVMHIKALDIPGMEVEEVLASAIEPPAPERVLAAMDKLRMVGALDARKDLTSLGRVLLQLPVDATMGKMCLYGAFFRCLDPVLSLAAILTSRDPFMAPMQLREEAEMVKDRWCPPDFRSDALCILRAYTRWWEMQSRGDFVAANRFCQDNFLSKLTLLQIQQVKGHLFQSMEKAEIISVIQTSSLNLQGANGQGHSYSRYRRPRETDAEFNINQDSNSLLAALIAVSSPPNFAIRSGKASYRTSQDKSCLMHPSSVCHTKYTKHKPYDAANLGEKEIFAFSEKIRNASGAAGNNANTMLRGCTRLDPLTYMLFGASEVRVLGDGVECDFWLPITGNMDALDNLEKLRSIMDVIMLRVFEGIGKRSNQDRRRGQGGANGDSRTVEDEDEGGEDEDDWADRTDLSLSPQEISEFEHMTQAIVRVLDGYAQERGWVSSSRGSTRPASPVSGMGSLSLGFSGGFGGEGVGLTPSSSAPVSRGGSRWTSRSQTPDLASVAGAGAAAAAAGNANPAASTAPSSTSGKDGSVPGKTAGGARGSWRGRSRGRGGAKAAGHGRSGEGGN